MDEKKIKQYEIEYNYIINNFFNNIQVLSPRISLKNKPFYKYNALLNEKLYVIFKSNSGNIIIIPNQDNLFKGDFDDIYEINLLDNDLFFTITRKHDDVIELFNYNFHLFDMKEDNSNDYIEGVLFYSVKNDKNDYIYRKFKKENNNIELFPYKIYANQLNSEKEIVIRIKNNDYEKSIYDSSFIFTYDNLDNKQRFEKITIDENMSFIENILNILDERLMNNRFVKKKEMKNKKQDL